MDRAYFYSTMNGEGTLDYELYLNTKQLLSCQKEFTDFCNRDELQFQVVHQVEELCRAITSPRRYSTGVNDSAMPTISSSEIHVTGPGLA